MSHRDSTPLLAARRFPGFVGSGFRISDFGFQSVQRSRGLIMCCGVGGLKFELGRAIGFRR